MTTIRTITVDEYESGVFSLIVDFTDRNFQNCNLASSSLLVWINDNGNSGMLKIPESIYQGKDLNTYMTYQSREKEQVVFLFVPDEMLDKVKKEIEYDSDFNVTRKYVSV